MNPKQLALWWKDAQEAAAPVHAAAAAVAYVREHGEADLDDLRELLTDQGIAPAEQLFVLSGLVDQGALREHEEEDGAMVYRPGQGVAEAKPEAKPEARLSLDSDRAARESASAVVDRIIDQGAASGVVIADEVRQKVRAAIIAARSKKNSPNPP